ncbi:hypothetical protein BofuT4_uP123070.1 [Botrytis cinerea T4]|uniref:Uncharacterized protein n=1 Tax=Botryotinia fuckeliana (strain T4) TaxID=999810 RepID=G2YNU0_BOTF4|nr:hypothetical protein BofuT4_uP123070.1 [Botrytis cinerea T4]
MCKWYASSCSCGVLGPAGLARRSGTALANAPRRLKWRDLVIKRGLQGVSIFLYGFLGPL